MKHKIFSKSIIKNFLGLTFLCSILLSACYPHHPQSTFNAQGPVGVQQEELFVLMFWLAIAVFAIVQSILIYVLIFLLKAQFYITKIFCIKKKYNKPSMIEIVLNYDDN